MNLLMDKGKKFLRQCVMFPFVFTSFSVFNTVWTELAQSANDLSIYYQSGFRYQ